jgi:tetratricopeptide (TPR) repeat protein
MRDLRIFVSSPGDVAEERVLTRRVIERVAAVTSGWVRLEPIFWEHEPLRASAGFQEQILPPSQCDIVVMILWSRLGTRLPSTITRPDGSRYASGTEFEFECAVESYKEKGLPDLLVYRKTARPVAPLDSEAEVLDRLRQKKALDSFLEKWFRADDGSFTAAFHPFESLPEYENLLEEHLRKLVETRIGEAATTETKGPRRLEWTAGSPFRGLEVFQYEHAPVFFGRTAATSEVLNALRKQDAEGRPFVLILGMSGCGKSSLARAGILPLLTQPGVIEGVAMWRTARLRPGDAGSDLFAGLAASLLREGALPELGADGTDSDELAHMLRDNPEASSLLIKGGLSQAAAELAQAEGLKRQPTVRLVLLVDQLEEIFTTKGISATERARFIEALDALVRSRRVWVLATLRSDFYPRCIELPVLAALKESTGQYDLLPPNQAEIGQMIRCPAQLAGLAFEESEQTGERLDDLLRDAASRNPEALPLLQFTLEELYKQRRQDGLLTLESNQELGGVEGALAQRAGSVFGRQAPDVQAAFPAVLSSLVTIGLGETETATRCRAPLESFRPGTPARELVDAYVEARLFVTDRDDRGRAVVSVAHEALLEHWPLLREWLEHNRELLRVRVRVAASAAQWERENRSSECLLASGKRLAEAEELLNAKEVDLQETERRFVAASLARGRRAWWLKRAAVAALFVLALLAAGAAFVANSKRAEAVAAREESEAVTDFLSSMLGSVNPKEIGRDVLVRDVLDEASESVEQELVGQPLIQARLMFTMGEVYRELGLYEPAGSLLDQALSIRVEQLGDSDALVADSLHGLADLHHDQGDYDRARSLYERTLGIRERALGPDHPEVAFTLNNLANLFNDLGDYGKAVETHRRVLEIRESALGPDDPDVATTLSNLSWALKMTGAYDEARPLVERAIEILEKARGPDHVALATFLTNLAVLNATTGNHDAARPQFERALAIRIKALGPDHKAVGVALANLAIHHASLGEFDAARPLFERSQAIVEKALGPEHPQAINGLSNLAAFLEDTGHREEALPLFERVVRLREKVLGPEHPEVAVALDNLGSMLINLDQYDAARLHFERALAIREETLGPDHPHTALGLERLGNLHRLEGAFDEAQPLLERSLAIREKTLGPDHPDLTTAMASLADLLREREKPLEAEQLLDRALAINEASYGPDHPSIANIEESRGLLFMREKDYGKARFCFERALAIRQKNKGPDHPTALRNTYLIACVCALGGNNEEALEFLRRAVDNGFDEPAIAEDPNLDSIRGDPRFEALVARVMERSGEG